MLKKLKEKTVIAKTSLALSVASIGAINSPFAVTNANADSLMKSIIDKLLTLVVYVGVILAVWGIVQFFLALKNEDSDSKSRAGMTIVAGVALITIKTIISGLQII